MTPLIKALAALTYHFWIARRVIENKGLSGQVCARCRLEERNLKLLAVTQWHNSLFDWVNGTCTSD
jgi:hypothetical protein